MAEDDDKRGGRDVYWEILKRVEQKVDSLDKKVENVNSRIDKFFYNEFAIFQTKLARFPDPDKIVLRDTFDPNDYVTKKDFRPIQWGFNAIIVTLFLALLAAILASVGIHPYFGGVEH